MIVAPERDTPGTSASAWARPTARPSRAWICSIDRDLVLTFSATSSTRPSTISATLIR